MKTIVHTILVLGSGMLTNRLDDACRRALYVVDVPHVVSDKSFHPQVYFPVLEEQVRIKRSQSKFTIQTLSSKVQNLSLLEFFCVHTKPSSSRQVFIHTILGCRIHRSRVIDEFFKGLGSISQDFIKRFLQFFCILRVSRFWKG